ncbi:hypothetical protein D3C78_1816480 [compost metagenome]
MQARRIAWPLLQVQGVHGDDTDAVARRQPFEQRGLGQQQVDATVVEHVGQAFGRVVRIQRHIGTAGLDDGQHTDEQLRRTLGGNRHAHVRANALIP